MEKNKVILNSKLAVQFRLEPLSRGMLLVLLMWIVTACNPSVTIGQDALIGWKELRGRTLIPSGEQGARELFWRFAYGKNPSVLRRVADPPWQTALELTFSIRSDRDGRLFVRIDQKGGKIFLTSFDVTREWRKVTVPYSDFQPVGLTSGKVDPALISEVYLVDLNGSDGGAVGSREIFLKELAFHEQEGEGSSGLRLPLVAFDAAGRILDLKQFESLGTSGGRWCYLSDEHGAALPMKIIDRGLTVDGVTVEVPTLVVDTAVPAALEILYWPVGEAFKVRLRADGSGAGIQGALRQGAILVNLELARTRYLSLSQYVKGVKGNFEAPLRRIGEVLANIDPQASLRAQAAVADRLLLEMLELSRDAVRSAARGAVDAQLAPGPEVTVPTPQPGVLSPGVQVTLRLEETSFWIGMGQGFGFVTKTVAPEKVDRYYSNLRKLGFNMVTLPLYWDQIVDRNGEYTRWRDTLRFDTLARLGYTFHAHGFVQSGMPESVRKLKGDSFLAAAEKHMSKVATDFWQLYGDRIVLWQAINEPASNAFGGTSIESRLNMVSDLIGHLKSTIQDATVVVNDYDWERGLEADRPAAVRTITGTLPFYRELMKERHRPDVLAVEWYPGCRVDRPEFRVDIAEPCMDLLDTNSYWDRFITLGRPLIFTESNFPGSMKKNDRNGYAWGRWDAQAQAQAAVDTFLLALSKPEILGWVWWSITDDEPWNRDGGLYTAGGQSKPVLDRLTAEIAALKKPIIVRVQTAGSLPLPRMPGTWRITVDNGPSWIVVRDRTGKVTLEDKGKMANGTEVEKNGIQ